MKEEEHGDGLLAVVVYGEVLEMGRYDWRTVFWWDWPATWVPAWSPGCKPERLGEEEGRVGRRRREEGRVERRRGEWEGEGGRRESGEEKEGGGGKSGMLTIPAVLQGRWSYRQLTMQEPSSSGIDDTMQSMERGYVLPEEAGMH